jgi:hypothetical protein
LVPENEKRAVGDAGSALHIIAMTAATWASALDLYKFASSKPAGIAEANARTWRFIAAREGAMQLFHLADQLHDYASMHLRDCPTMAKFVDKQMLKNAIKLLEARFPNIEAMRDSVAHWGERVSRPRTHEAGDFEIDGQIRATGEGRIFAGGSLIGDKYVVTARGIVLELEITDETLNKIVGIVSMFFDAFAGVIAESEKHWRR